MKKGVIVFAALMIFGISAQAQTTGGTTTYQKGQAGQGVTSEGMRMQMMPMMKQMTGQGMMMQDMMQMMTDMMKMQQKMLEGVKPAEKEVMSKELSRMMETMNARMSEMRGMMSQGMMMQGMMSGTTPTAPATGGQKTLEKSEAGVTVKVTPEGSDGTVRFKVALETHAVDLDKYKFEDIVALRAGGKEYRGRVISREGSGHHRSAVIEFENPKTKEFAIVIKDVAGVKERVFAF